MEEKTQMVTQYIRIKMELCDYKKDTNLKFNRKVMETLNGFDYYLNRHLLIYGVVDYEHFVRTGETKASDWVEYLYVNEDGTTWEGITDNVVSILPTYMGLTDPKGWKFDKDYLTRPLHLYFYIKIVSKDVISEQEMLNLKGYISGQLSDGWGEGFEVHDIELVKRPKKGKAKVLRLVPHFEWDENKYEVVDRVERCDY